MKLLVYLKFYKGDDEDEPIFAPRVETSLDYFDPGIFGEAWLEQWRSDAINQDDLTAAQTAALTAIGSFGLFSRLEAQYFVKKGITVSIKSRIDLTSNLSV